MNSLLVYLLKTGIGLIILYTSWYVFLKSETTYRQNRFFILLTTLVILIIPALSFPRISFQSNTVFFKTLDVVTINSSDVNIENSNAFDFFKTLVSIYIIGVIIFSINFLIKVFTVTNLILRNKVKYYNGIKVISTKKEYSSFSFMNYVFIPEKDITTNDFDQIFKHEVVHIKQLHSLDILIFELLCILQWFNPFVYFLKKALKETHEYLADKGVIEQGYSLTDYQLLLLEQCVGVQYGFTNNFNKSLTLKRLTMMNKKSNRNAKLRILFVLPIVISMLLVFACNDSESIKSEKNDVIKEEVSVSKTDQIYDEVDVMPEYPGGMEALATFISQNIIYPDKAKSSNATGKVYVSFVISETGKVENVEVAQSENEIFNQEAIRVVSALANWTPGYKDNKAVKVRFTLPIKFQLN